MTTIKQADWLKHKAEQWLERKQKRGVTTAVEPRRKVACTCIHTAKHHKKTGRCRGKMPTTRAAQGHEIADIFGVPPFLLAIPASCGCRAGVR
jgi:hypothetical protein